jgi:hypothetical protein
MDLTTLKSKVEAKDRVRQQLLGQHEMLLDNMRKMGFETIEEMEKSLSELQTENKIMENKYDEGVKIFVEKYKDLL